MFLKNFYLDHEKIRNLIDWTNVTTTVNINMHLIILIGFIILNCGSLAISVSEELPCDFLDSMNISDGVTYSNGTVVYEHFEFPVGQYTKINYTFNDDNERMTVAPYTRGCICNRKSCIRLCCPFGSIQVKSRQCQPNEVAKSVELFSTIYINKNTTNVQPVLKFPFIYGYPCKRMHLNKREYIIISPV